VTNTEFNTVWSKYVFGGASLDVTSGYVSPTGDNDAFKFDLDVGTGGVLFTQNATINPLNAQTLSVYMKGENGGEKVKLALRNTSSTGASGDIITLTSEWERYTVTLTTSSANRGFQFRLTTSEGVSDQVFYVYGPQLEEGTTASSFVANTTGSPKFITGATFGPRVPMILVEPSATNLLSYSEEFGQWNENTNGNGVSPVITSDQEIAPNGLQEADKIVFNLGGGTSTGDEVSLSLSPSLSGQPYAGSIYLKGENGGEVILLRTVTGGYTELTLTTEWQRFESIETYVSGTRRFEIGLRGGIVSGGINNTATIYAWGAQLETGSVATSYIPTSGSTAQRASDELVISGSDFSDFFNGSAGTFFIQAQNRTPELNGAVLMGQNSNKLFFYKSNPNRLSTYDGGSFTHHDGLVPNQLFNAAVTFNTSNRSSSLDGSALDTDTINTQWAGADILKIGFGYSNNFNGHYRRILFWPYNSDSL
jgi:hypothetical protein